MAIMLLITILLITVLITTQMQEGLNPRRLPIKKNTHIHEIVTIHLQINTMKLH